MKQIIRSLRTVGLRQITISFGNGYILVVPLTTKCIPSSRLQARMLSQAQL